MRKGRLAGSDVGAQAESITNRRVTQRGAQGRGPVPAVIGGQQEPPATYGSGKGGGAELKPSQAGHMKMKPHGQPGHNQSGWRREGQEGLQ